MRPAWRETLHEERAESVQPLEIKRKRKKKFAFLNSIYEKGEFNFPSVSLPHYRRLSCKIAIEVKRLYPRSAGQ